MIGLPKSTVFRILHTLEAENMIFQDPESGKYLLSYEITHLGEVAGSSHLLTRVAAPIMTELAEQVGQTSNLHIIEGFQRRCIHQVIGPNFVRRFSYTGAIAPLCYGSAGKVLLAFSSDEFQKNYFQYLRTNSDFEAVNSIAKLQDNLCLIKEKGYAISKEEREVGAASISAPIFDFHLDKITACITISGPSTMFTKEYELTSTPLVKKAAKNISVKLGY